MGDVLSSCCDLALGDRAGSWLRLRYAFEDVWAEFVVDGRGQPVWVSRSENVLLSEVTELLLGPVFSCIAAQRGLSCLHASVVRLDDRVVAVLGPSGAGKSTTALRLCRQMTARSFLTTSRSSQSTMNG